MFFFTGLLFWAHVIEPGPLRSRLSWPTRIGYVVGAMVVGWMLAITLVLVPHPLYAPLRALVHRPGGISALTDQQLAAGVMWVPGSLAYGLVLFIGVYRWLDPAAQRHAAASGAHHLRRTDSHMPPLPFADSFLAGSLLTDPAAPGAADRDRDLVHDRGQARAQGHARILAGAARARGGRGRGRRPP